MLKIRKLKTMCRKLLKNFIGLWTIWRKNLHNHCEEQWKKKCSQNQSACESAIHSNFDFNAYGVHSKLPSVQCADLKYFFPISLLIRRRTYQNFQTKYPPTPHRFVSKMMQRVVNSPILGAIVTNGAQPHRGMATLKVIQMRLKSVKNIQKITQSMKMVSAAKWVINIWIVVRQLEFTNRPFFPP